MATQTQFQLDSTPGCIHELRFEQHYAQQRRRLHSLCEWMTGNAAQARQLAARVFIDAWRKPVADDRSAPTASDEERVLASFATAFRGLYQDDAATPPVGGPQLVGRAATPATPIRAAVAALPSPHRLLYLLHEVEGCPASTLAGWLELDATVCARMIHQARMQMRHALADA